MVYTIYGYQPMLIITIPSIVIGWFLLVNLLYPHYRRTAILSAHRSSNDQRPKQTANGASAPSHSGSASGPLESQCIGEVYYSDIYIYIYNLHVCLYIYIYIIYTIFDVYHYTYVYIPTYRNILTYHGLQSNCLMLHPLPFSSLTRTCTGYLEAPSWSEKSFQKWSSHP